MYRDWGPGQKNTVWKRNRKYTREVKRHGGENKNIEYILILSLKRKENN